MTMLLEVLERHRARNLFRSSHLKQFSSGHRMIGLKLWVCLRLMAPVLSST